MTDNSLHESYMRQAFELSKSALPGCRPNPPVGCVFVKDGEVVSSGFSQPPGNHHAEAGAIAAYTGSYDGLVAYVTLEPCSFQGRTPSCAKALVRVRPEKVYVAILDPDTRNSGAGIKILEDAGIDVEVGLLGEEVASFLNPYLIRN
ncbi:riboflavin-specific deaminase [Vibrio sp. vnigr-6D03]|uniref:bifunctional diaminohydroxyphosphoribosylaminopyrimidine deaminase/5-amino-6-(5-phosphoribosylamino)uracil reductase RibD n=1 Tax=Vibrio TaxID=662 RepID=UPI000C34A9CC|nr:MULTISPECIES: bifunctional diaminohydroxyphosphoribosylaminopyrimidine deaminase/5-amino-6-(5-phosphoribosylamino)uracil reductase RibD [Vibrio]MDP2572041.1 bifunctional diaminohydroxyphosphoribosylaminopyrimidine deaminase/5-amino-6-(5-phosphoribosylamino)uracil reductase RibD [Vibrio penaeicida]PKF81309.1 riboflavin-specific deaminase [Vibrio sp. vnigr-6D03]